MTNADDRLASGIFSVAEEITSGLERFIEAGYHLRDQDLIEERQRMLREPGAIRQRPYIEATPSYRSSRRIADLQNVPEHAKAALSAISSFDLGLYDPPYEHQAQALEHYFSGSDLFIATGTGSGKTESFLSAIIAQLILEHQSRPRIAAMHGVRALLLYPMNALVNDQIFRIRRLFGDNRVAELLRRGDPLRQVTFGSYTSRTAYHGHRTNAKDRDRIGKPIESFYLRIEAEKPELAAELKRSGRWPAKDLDKFYGAGFETRDANGRLRDGHWNKRLFTHESDRELLTRHEMLATCPDILVTNYSMLEYMLLRPFERPIFEATSAWLAADSRNQFIVVLDEAHLYRGSSGAEVGLLLRRLAGRLGVTRDRIRFILTTASIGSGEESDKRAFLFANSLTGLEPSHKKEFAIVRGTPDAQPAKQKELTEAEIHALAAFNMNTLRDISLEFESAYQEILKLALACQWEKPPTSSSDMPHYLGRTLRGIANLHRIVEACAGKAVEIESLVPKAFGHLAATADEAVRRSATAALISLGSNAVYGGRNLFPARMHLFYRGLPGLYACCSTICDRRRSGKLGAVLGRMFAEPQLYCSCKEHARVFEVLSHRDCGATFLRGYVQHAQSNFVWTEPGAGARRIFSNNGGYSSSRLIPIEMLVDGAPHDDVVQADKAREAWLDVRTGIISREHRSGEAGFRSVWLPNLLEAEARGIRFKPCPVCQRDWQEGNRAEGSGVSKIEPHATLGENPFTALTSAQLRTQPANLSAFAAKHPENYPNLGRKVLVFSDGRQKAARLARDMPRMIQRDAFRQVIALAVNALGTINREAAPNQILYTAVLHVLATCAGFSFRGSSGGIVMEDVRRYRREFRVDELSEALNEGAFSPASEEYRVALLEQIGGKYYSLTDSTIGWIEPAARPLRRLLTELASVRPELESYSVALPIVYAWMGAAADGYAIDESIPPHARARAAGFGESRSDWSASGRFRKPFRKSLVTELSWTDAHISKVEALLSETFMHGGDRRFINPATCRINVDLTADWYRCAECFILEPLALNNTRCAHCGAAGVVTLSPLNDEYLRARKGYWRDPVLAAIGGVKPTTFQVAEHTAQLGHRDASRTHSTTERYELRFQDILIEKTDTPVDVLSCTTTMEVGVDIGSLVAVGLRNIPPERSNYQQRAGRAGRRGTGVSTVVTYGDRGPHGSYYFSRPSEIIAGPVRDPEVQVNNAKLARRHVNAILIQDYVASIASSAQSDNSLETSLGTTRDFFFGERAPNLIGFKKWIEENIATSGSPQALKIAAWLPAELSIEHATSRSTSSIRERAEWVSNVAEDFVRILTALDELIPDLSSPIIGDEDTDQEDLLRSDSQSAQSSVASYLLEFLFDENLLPTYSFPTDLASFLVDEARTTGTYTSVIVREMPQQDMSKAISEYAPGRLIVIDSATYRSGGVTARTLFTEIDRARPLFDSAVDLVSCDECGYLRVTSSEAEAQSLSENSCVTCGASLKVRKMIQPEVYTPEGRDELPDDDREQDLTFATSAQFPLPADGDVKLESSLIKAGQHLEYTHASDQQLVAINKGVSQGVNATGGFFVCVKCGSAHLDAPTSRRHARNYNIQGNAAQNVRDCDGQFRNVVLGHRFVSDVLLLRINIESPLVTQLTSSLDGRIMEDALASAGESILLSASRILDIDPQEFGVGYRIVPKASTGEGDPWRLDIYLYDTSAGGAGYAEMASRRLTQVLESAIQLLNDCDCSRSCTKCLQHFRNQHVQGRLDRRLGEALLCWTLHGDVPPKLSLEKQVEKSRALRRSLELEKISLRDITGKLTVRSELTGQQLLVEIWPALLASNDETASRLVILNEYLISRDLPFVHDQIRGLLGHT